MLFDTHCHLTDEAFAADIEPVLARARIAGVRNIVTVSSHLADSRRMIGFLRPDEGLFGTVGVHPHNAADVDYRTLYEISGLATESGVLAIGETGLDYYYDNCPREQQLIALGAHLSMAMERDLPMVVHSRDAVEDTMSFLEEARGKARGVLHCFSGPRDLLDLALDVGWMVSFTGITTFKSFDPDILRAVPADRYMIETDGPYLAPVPHRGKRNEPAYLSLIAEAVGRIRGVSLEQVAEESTRNAMNFFGLTRES